MHCSFHRTVSQVSLPHGLLVAALLLGCLGFVTGQIEGQTSNLGAAEFRSAQNRSAAKIELASLVQPHVGRMKEITFNDLKLDLKKDRAYDASLLTKKVKLLKGQPVRIRGYMVPGFQEKGIMQFVLTHKISGCLGGGEELDDLILVEMTPPVTVEYKTKPVNVEGFLPSEKSNAKAEYWRSITWWV